VDELFEKLIAIKANIFFPIILSHIPVFVIIQKSEELLTLLFSNLSGNVSAGYPDIVFKQDIFVCSSQMAKIFERLNKISFTFYVDKLFL
jgi:hypothetical protein